MTRDEFISAIEARGFYVDDDSDFLAVIWYAPDHYFTEYSVWADTSVDWVEFYANNVCLQFPHAGVTQNRSAPHMNTYMHRHVDDEFYRCEYLDMLMLIDTRYKVGHFCPDAFKVIPREFL